MRQILLIACVLLVIGETYGQINKDYSRDTWPRPSYVLLDNSGFSVHNVQSQHSKEGEINKMLEIFNIIVPINRDQQPPINKSYYKFEKSDSLLIAISLLPAIEKDKIVWRPILLDTIPTRYLYSMATVVDEGRKLMEKYRQDGNPLDHFAANRENLLPIVKRGGHYWIPDALVLAEYFIIHTQRVKSLKNADYVTINIKSPQVAYNPSWRFLSPLVEKHMTYDDYNMKFGLVLEKKVNGLYTFWSRALMTVSHPSLREHGSVRFEYKPGTGLVTGQYYGLFPFSRSDDLSTYFNEIFIDGKLYYR